MDQLVDAIAAHRNNLVRMARRQVQNPAWAEDAVSEAIMAALENPDAFARRAELGTWLGGILKHKLVDQVRRHTRECQAPPSRSDAGFCVQEDEASVEPSHADRGRGDPLERLSQRQFMAQFETCLKALPRQQARAFMLRNWMEQDTADICEVLGVSANHLGVMLHRARNRLRASMQTQWAP
jgi:RNA polymerase sigma-70 factor, ECF subfamily